MEREPTEQEKEIFIAGLTATALYAGMKMRLERSREHLAYLNARLQSFRQFDVNRVVDDGDSQIVYILKIEVPSAELGSLTSIPMWEEIYDKLAALALEHRSTLVFVNTRKFVEKISFELAARLGQEAVAAHHGSLSRALRLYAEQRLKNGEIRVLVATASL